MEDRGLEEVQEQITAFPSNHRGLLNAQFNFALNNRLNSA